MPVSEKDWTDRILDDVGAELPDVKAAIDKVRPQISAIWAMYADKATISPRMQFFYARIAALDRIVGQFRNLTSASLGQLNPRLGEKVDRMANLIRKNWTEELHDELNLIARSRVGVVDQITKKAPEYITTEPNPNDLKYFGSAMRRS